MEQITTEKEIQQVLKNLYGIQDQVKILLGLAQKAKVKLIMDFSEDCAECGEQAPIIQENRDVFYWLIEGIISFQQSIEKLTEKIDPDSEHNDLNKDWPPKPLTQEDLNKTRTGNY